MGRYSGQFEPRSSALHEDEDLLWVVPFRVRYMLGVCGYRFAGKSTAISYLVEKKGFRHYSLSTTLRSLGATEGIVSTRREALQDFGDELRERHGNKYLAIQTLRQIRRDFLSHRSDSRLAARVVVGGFKHPDELEVFRCISEFSAIAVVVGDDKARFDRAQRVGMPEFDLENGTELETFEDFQKTIDGRDRYGNGLEEHGQAVERVLDLVGAKDRLTNDGTIPALMDQLDNRVDVLDKTFRSSRG